jgi:hypothetical protein
MYKFKINNMSANAHKYEFIVAFMYEGEVWYWGAYRYAWDAEAGAKECGGFVIHNVRIAGYKEDA